MRLSLFVTSTLLVHTVTSLCPPQQCIHYGSSCSRSSHHHTQFIPSHVLPLHLTKKKNILNSDREEHEIESLDIIEESNPSTSSTSRRNLLRNAVIWTTAMNTYLSPMPHHSNIAFALYTIDRIDPEEKLIYTRAQKVQQHKKQRTKNQKETNKTEIEQLPPLQKTLWIGCGTFDNKISGVYKNLFLPKTEVIAVDLLEPKPNDLNNAISYAKEVGNYTLKFYQGDATNLQPLFFDEVFDTVVCSMFLCQDFDPEVVVKEIYRVLKPDGLFGFYEHVEDIDGVIVKMVFGERSIVTIQYYPEMSNIMAGVVQKKVV